MSGGIEENEKNNSWKLLHRIFHEEMFKPMYNPGVRQLNEDDIDKIYQYNCDIAYEMFKTQNQKLSFTYDELSKLLPEYNSEEYVKKSHGLFSYMRYNNGAVEFIHNHVRDFFLCEKILRTMSEWYENDYSADKIALGSGTLLKYYYFERQTRAFIKEALKDNYKTITAKCTPEHLPSIFDLFHNAGGVLNYNYFNEHIDFINLSQVIIDNISCVYLNIYLNITTDYITWFNASNINTYVLSMMKNNLERADFCALYLYGVNLNWAHLVKANLRRAVLLSAQLKNADLREADLREADLEFADLREADLKFADLRKTNLKFVDLRDADLRETNLREAIVLHTKYNKYTMFPKDFTPKKIKWFYVE